MTMTSDDHPEEPGTAPAATTPKGGFKGLRRSLARVLFGFDPDGVTARLDGLEQAARQLAGDHEAAGRRMADEIAGLRGSVERRLDLLEEAHRGLQSDLELTRDQRLPGVEKRLDGVEEAAGELTRSLAEVRDERLAAAVRRSDVLIDRLARELEELGSLVERSLLGEPLPAPGAGPPEDRLAEALDDIQPKLLDAFRGSEEEISHRLQHHLGLVRDCAPVLDLGCGRGELLSLLREAGVEAAGVEMDSALAQASRRRGLRVFEGDAEEVLRGQEDASWGAVTALHLLEHLSPAAVLRLLAEIRRVVRPGGSVIVECPNPHSLRVGASLFWVDPTHLRPLPPETLELYMTASGLQVEAVELLHPFPAEECFATSGDEAAAAGGADVEAQLARLRLRLDVLLNGPRDVLVRAMRPGSST